MSKVRAALAVTAFALMAAGCSRQDANDVAAPYAATLSSKPLAFNRVKSKGGAIVVSSPSFADGGPVPDIYTAYGAGSPPPVMWTPVANAKSYAVVIEDPDAPGPTPYVHWIVYQAPTTVSSLDDQSQGGTLPPGALQGRSSAGSAAYAPFHPPVGDKPHHYYLEVFALDGPLSVPAAPDLAALEKAMTGHVLASGETVGLYMAPAAPTPATS